MTAREVGELQHRPGPGGVAGRGLERISRAVGELRVVRGEAVQPLGGSGGETAVLASSVAVGVGLFLEVEGALQVLGVPVLVPRR